MLKNRLLAIVERVWPAQGRHRRVAAVMVAVAVASGPCLPTFPCFSVLDPTDVTVVTLAVSAPAFDSLTDAMTFHRAARVAR